MSRAADYPYTAMIGDDLFAHVSKEALAAVVASLLSDGGDHPEQVRPGLVAELTILAEQGIIPRRPAARFRGGMIE